MESGRQQARAPILTQVETAGPNMAGLGRACDLSVGGILIETSDTLPLSSDVVIRFTIPPSPRPVEVPGRVVRSDPGKAMAIAFLGVPESYRKRILDYIQEAQSQEAPAEMADLHEPAASDASRRRSARIPRRIAVVLNWQDEEGRGRQEAAETKFISRYGALLTSYSELEPGRVLRLTVPEGGGEARSRVVYSAAAQLPGRTEVAVEFMGIDNFWQVPFPTDLVTFLPTRRRSARQRKNLPLELSWESTPGGRHQETSESRDVSRHGVRLTASKLLEADRLLQVRLPGSDRWATARIVWWKVETEASDRLQMGLEFLGTEGFWGMDFTTDRDYVAPESSPKPRQ